MTTTSTSSPYGMLILGIILTVNGMQSLIAGDGGSLWGVPLVDWIGWVLAPAGIIICILSIRALRRGAGKTKPKQYTDEDAARAKEEMDRLYGKERGSLPEEPRPEKDS